MYNYNPYNENDWVTVLIKYTYLQIVGIVSPTTSLLKLIFYLNKSQSISASTTYMYSNYQLHMYSQVAG